MLNTCCLPGSLEAAYMPGRGCLHNQSPTKTWALGLQRASVVDSTSCVLSQLVAGGISASCMTLLGEALGNLCFISYRLRPHEPFPFADYLYSHSFFIFLMEIGYGHFLLYNIAWTSFHVSIYRSIILNSSST